MAKQWNKNEKLEILTFAELNGIKLTAQKYNIAKSTIHRWRVDAQNNFDNLEWGCGSQNKQKTKRRISISTIDSNDAKKKCHVLN
ncbi:hypothetical protein M1771_02700 [Spiroplasma citri]|uniref:Transposase n=1 Tax=Spiroplasma citri TaxID=2133 RepID=A0AAX3T028_SPICI|nr:hypothetical protein [Spiroplasma citri]WFG96940.1 hypothetical protein M0C40_02705 [Spiroplasma citri]WFH00839.1 hypothetical protein M1771_02700 [Spiroplasma citri]